MDKIAEFARKRRPKCKEEPKNDFIETQNILPWYKRPIIKEDFYIKEGKDKKFYIRHKEWTSKKTWIGPYLTEHIAKGIIDLYVIESLKSSLDKSKNLNFVHSIIIDNEKEFFKP